MAALLDTLTALAIVVGLGFFLAGTVVVLRFPDVYNRLHGTTKVDNLGLGFVVFGLALQAESPAQVVKLGLIWLLVLLAGTTTAHLIARTALRSGQPAWERR
jgi:multicomponent Na+:H+ antiporter subunit G